MDTTKRAAWNCPTCHAINVGARCGCTTAPVVDTLERINALHLVIPPRRAKR